MVAQIPILEKRRDQLCKKYMMKIKKEEHPLHFMLPRPEFRECSYDLGFEQNNNILFENKAKCRTLRSEQFFTFKYF